MKPEKKKKANDFTSLEEKLTVAMFRPMWDARDDPKRGQIEIEKTKPRLYKKGGGNTLFYPRGEGGGTPDDRREENRRPTSRFFQIKIGLFLKKTRGEKATNTANDERRKEVTDRPLPKKKGDPSTRN